MSVTVARTCVMNGTEVYAVLVVSCTGVNRGREQLMGLDGEL